MAELWAAAPEARIVIHPLLTEFQAWGSGIPASALQEAATRQKALRLETVTNGRDVPIGEIRAGGPRFQAQTGSLEERERLLSHALDLGGGFLELREGSGRILGSVRTRCLDLEQGVVAPLAMRAANLSRAHASGACPACAGEGRLPFLDLDLIVKDRRASSDSEAFFRPEALAVIKGVRRSFMVPFFRRLTQEKLWADGRAFKEFGDEERDLVLHGYWKRPGHGSFLKDKKADPQEVSSWLRWDGLFRTILGQFERSTDSGWTTAVRKSIHAVSCVVCEGSGLAAQARVVERGGKSLQAWILNGRIGQLSAALKGSACRSESERRTLDRLLDCWAPLVRTSPEARLGEPFGDQALARAVYERVVQSFTRLGVVR
jgi:excinuclease UvrABC ATPase subunit